MKLHIMRGKNTVYNCIYYTGASANPKSKCFRTIDELLNFARGISEMITSCCPEIFDYVKRTKHPIYYGKSWEFV